MENEKREGKHEILYRNKLHLIHALKRDTYSAQHKSVHSLLIHFSVNIGAFKQNSLY